MRWLGSRRPPPTSEFVFVRPRRCCKGDDRCPSEHSLSPSEGVVKAQGEARRPGVVWHRQVKCLSSSASRERIEVRGEFQNNPNNFFVFSLFQVDGIGALAKLHSPHRDPRPAKRDEGDFLPRSNSGFYNTLRKAGRGGLLTQIGLRFLQLLNRRGQRLVDVLHDVVNVFDANRESHHVIAHAGGGEFFRPQLAMRGGCRVCRQ